MTSGSGDFLDDRQVARMLKVPVERFRDLVRRGLGPRASKIGFHHVYLRHDIAGWIARGGPQANAAVLRSQVRETPGLIDTLNDLATRMPAARGQLLAEAFPVTEATPV